MGHRASLLRWNKQSSWMWPSQCGDAGPGVQENLNHCTDPITLATFYLLLGLWMGRKKDQFRVGRPAISMGIWLNELDII